MNLTELTPLLDRLDELNVDYDCSLSKGRKVSRIWISSLRATDENYHPALSAVTSAFGRLDKEISAGTQSWSARKDGTSMTMYRIAQCKVVSYRTVAKKVMKEIETDEVEVEEVPVYDCSDAE